MERDAVNRLTDALPIPGRRKRAIARELEAHLEDSRRDLELAGWPAEEAARESLHRLGDLDEIAGALVQVHRRSRRAPVAAVLGLTSALIVGMFSVGGSMASAHPARHVSAHVVHHVTAKSATHHYHLSG
jgi:hypothetical protein